VKNISDRIMKEEKKNIDVIISERDKLVAENQQRMAELDIISSVGEAMSKQLDVQTVTRIVGDKIRSIFDTEVTEILLLDVNTNTIRVPYSFYRDYANVEQFPLGEGMTSKVINCGKPIVYGTAKEQLKAGALFDDAVGEADETESYMGVPIRIAGKVMGVVSVQSYKKNAYNDDNVKLLSTLSASMGIALENARLFEETKSLLSESQQRNAELGVINSVQEGLVAHMDIQAIYDLVGEKIREIFDAQVVSIGKYDHKKKICEFKYDIEKGKRFYDKPRNFNSVDKHIIKSKKRLVINEDFVNNRIKLGGEKPRAAEGTELPKSAVWVPLVVGNVVTGYVSLQNVDRENAFGESEVQLLNTLSNSLSIALINAELFEETTRLLNETQQRNTELSILNAIQEGLVMEMDFEAIINLVGDKLREAMGFLDLGIRLYDKENDILKFPYEYEHGERLYIEDMPPTVISRYVLDSGKLLLIRENSEEAIRKLGVEGMSLIPGTDQSKSLVAVPIMLGNVAKGLILIENYEKHDAFSDSDVRLLTTLANSMSIALENARLFEQTKHLLHESRQRNAELSILNAIQEGLVMEMDLTGIINLVGDKLREALDFQDIGIRLYDKEKDLLHFHYEYERGERLMIDPMPPTMVSKYVLDKKEMLLVKHNDENRIKSLGIEGVDLIPSTDRSKSFIAVPILAGNEAKGLIIIENYEKEDAYSESDIRLLTTLANSMSVALENARLFDETLRLYKESEQRASDLLTVNRITKAIAGHLEINKLIEMVGESTKKQFKANIGYVALLNKKTQMIEFPYGYGEEFPPLKYGEGLTSKIIQTREPLLLNKMVNEKAQELGVKRIGVKAASYLGVPIPVGDEIIGALSVQSTEEENKFNEEDMRLLNTLATHVGIAINNANAYQELSSTLQDLKSTQDQLVAQEKLASLGELTAGIAHEIKNPLNFINNFSEVSGELLDEMKEELQNDRKDEAIELVEDIKQNLVKINQHGNRADSIVKGMLLHSRGTSGEKALTDINDLLDQYVNLAYHGMRAQDKGFNITIEKNYDESLGKINLVPQDISRVFLNLINNACYAANEKKQKNGNNFSPLLKVSTKDLKDRVKIGIMDNGNGIPESVKEQIFNPFFSTKPTGEGTGLGLSLSYDIVVKQHAGEITFESETGKYTEFIIIIPKS
jgi:GAF domain-containing protein